MAQWLLPGGQFNPDLKCTSVSDEQLAAYKEAQKEGYRYKNNGNENKNRDRATSSSNKKNSNLTPAELILKTAKKLSKSGNYHYSYGGGTCFSKYSDYNKGRPAKAYWDALQKTLPRKKYCGQSDAGADCGYFVVTVVRYCGYNMHYKKAESYFLGNSKWKTIKKPHMKQKGKTKPGDICIHQGGGFHIWINAGSGKRYEAQHHGKTFGHKASGGCSGANYIFRAVKFGDKKKLKKWRGISV